MLRTLDRNDKTIIFTQTKRDCDDLSEALTSEGIRNNCIHGDKTQHDRDKAMEMFKNGRFTTLIATDVASRGLDVKDIKLVVNFDFPKQIEDYVHRVGRTGRAGAVGKALSFMDRNEDKRIAKELVDLLKQGKQEISEDLLDLADYRGGNYGNKGGASRGGNNRFSGLSSGGSSNYNGGGGGGSSYNTSSRYNGNNNNTAGDSSSYPTQGSHS